VQKNLSLEAVTHWSQTRWNYGIKTDETFNDERTADKIYKEIKEVDNEKIKKLFELKGEEKKKAENKIIKDIINKLR